MSTKEYLGDLNHLWRRLFAHARVMRPGARSQHHGRKLKSDVQPVSHTSRVSMQQTRLDTVLS